MRHSIFLAVATLFLAVCTPSIGYSNTGPQTDGSQPDTTKFTVGIIYHTEFHYFVPKIKECIKGTNWNVITAVANVEQSVPEDVKNQALGEILRIFKNSNIVIFATHGKYENGKHYLIFGKGWVDTETGFKDFIELKQNAIVFAAACKTMAGDDNEDAPNSLVNIFKGKGAAAYVGYKRNVSSNVALDGCEDLLMGLVSGKTVKESVAEFRKRDLIPLLEDENIAIKEHYRIPRYYFGFMRGREAMTAMWERNDKAYAAALMQMKADLESCKSDSESGVLYVESFKKGVRAVLLENGAPEDKVDGTVDLLMGTFGLSLLKKEKK